MGTLRAVRDDRVHHFFPLRTETGDHARIRQNAPILLRLGLGFRGAANVTIDKFANKSLLAIGHFTGHILLQLLEGCVTLELLRLPFLAGERWSRRRSLHLREFLLKWSGRSGRGRGNTTKGGQ